MDHEARQGSKLRARDQNPGWWGVGFRDDEKNGSAVQGAAGTGIMRPHATPRLLTGALGGPSARGPGLRGEGRWEGAP